MPRQVYRSLSSSSQTSITSLIYTVLRSNFPLDFPGVFHTVEFLRHENHALVFSIKSLHSGAVQNELKVYDLRGLDTKLHRGRVNNMKRLRRNSACWWSCKWDGP